LTRFRDSGRSLEDWLAWQETLNPAEIDLGLERVRQVFQQLNLIPPPGAVFTVAGTNGKGSTVAVIDAVLRAAGRSTGAYTSPHLIRYNERIVLNGTPATDADIVSAFEAVEAARGDIQLTYFEFGTLAALHLFHSAGCDCWVLEVGLGGRLDAVNIVAADVAIITTVELDHQAWLGDSIELIAMEKAGIMRVGKPVFYGDRPVPDSVRQHAVDCGAELHCLGETFSFQRLDEATWQWHGVSRQLSGLQIPPGGVSQLHNQSVALAALESNDPELLDCVAEAPQLLANCGLPGRLQRYQDAHGWLLDVAHNPQAARALRHALSGEQPATVVVGMLADKHVEDFVGELELASADWLTCPTQGARGATASELAERLRPLLQQGCESYPSVEAAMVAARAQTPPGELILVCGSFGVVGPALQWLGLY